MNEHASSAAPVIEMIDVCFSYGSGGHPVLSDVSLVVEPGEYLAILGPNGGGKTTLLRLLLGLITPDSGTIRVFGKPPESVRGRIGYVPQLTTSVGDFPISVFDVVLMGRIGGRSWPGSRLDRRDRELALEALSRVNMDDLANESVSALSGGQRQRVLIARALASDPRLLLLDEPVASVDAANQVGVYGILERLNGEGVTVVMVTHDIGAVSSHVKSIACMNVRLFSHGEKLVPADIARTYGCPIDLVTHGVPHRVLGDHEEEG